MRNISILTDKILLLLLHSNLMKNLPSVLMRLNGNSVSGLLFIGPPCINVFGCCCRCSKRNVGSVCLLRWLYSLESLDIEFAASRWLRRFIYFGPDERVGRKITLKER